MAKITEIIKSLAKGVARSKVSVIGAVISAVIFPVLLISAILDMQGVVQNLYFVFFIYMVMGPLFIIGLILVLLGLLFFKGKEDIGLFAYEYIREQMTMPGRFSRIRRLISLTTILAILMVAAVGIISYTSFHYTESVEFCGQFCHRVMAPEYVTYRNSPHSRVPCVDCHIGESAEWLTKAKLSGVRQLVAVALDSYHRPIETPITSLRPTRQTCEKCHRPEMFHGDKLYVKDKYLDDQENTLVQTVLLMKVGSGGYDGRAAHGIHWHVSQDNKIIYKYADPARLNIYEVMLVRGDGSRVVYYKEDEDGDAGKIAAEVTKAGGVREMDCMDCHNRPTHVFLPPAEALDRKLGTGEIPAELPYVKAQALRVISRDYQSAAAAEPGIAAQLRSWYEANYPEIADRHKALIDKAGQGAQAAYAENVFPEMKIGWGTYQNFIGHRAGKGCFRCHDGLHRTRSGETISKDCETCHVILAEEESSPKVLQILKGL